MYKCGCIVTMIACLFMYPISECILLLCVFIILSNSVFAFLHLNVYVVSIDGVLFVLFLILFLFICFSVILF